MLTIVQKRRAALGELLSTGALVQRARRALADGAQGALTALIRLIELVLCNMFGTRVWKGALRPHHPPSPSPTAVP